MTELLELINRTFDLLFRPFPGALSLLLAVSAGAGLVMMLVFRATSDQKKVRRARDRLQAHLLEVRLFPDQLRVVLRAYGRILLGTAQYFRLSLKPLAVMFLPVTLIAVQLDRYLGRMPFQPQEPFLVKARLADPALLDQASLRLPDGLAVTAPAVRIPEESEVDWRLSAERKGSYVVEIVVAGRAFPKLVTASDRIARLSSRRVRDHFFQWLFDSGEPELPADSPLEAVEIAYPLRQINLGIFESTWLVPFLLFSLVAALALKFVLRVEI